MWQIFFKNYKKAIIKINIHNRFKMEWNNFEFISWLSQYCQYQVVTESNWLNFRKDSTVTYLYFSVCNEKSLKISELTKTNSSGCYWAPACICLQIYKRFQYVQTQRFEQTFQNIYKLRLYDFSLQVSALLKTGPVSRTFIFICEK